MTPFSPSSPREKPSLSRGSVLLYVLILVALVSTLFVGWIELMTNRITTGDIFFLEAKRRIAHENARALLHQYCHQQTLATTSQVAYAASLPSGWGEIYIERWNRNPATYAFGWPHNPNPFNPLGIGAYPQELRATFSWNVTYHGVAPARQSETSRAALALLRTRSFDDIPPPPTPLPTPSPPPAQLFLDLATMNFWPSNPPPSPMPSPWPQPANQTRPPIPISSLTILGDTSANATSKPGAVLYLTSTTNLNFLNDNYRPFLIVASNQNSATWLLPNATSSWNLSAILLNSRVSLGLNSTGQLRAAQLRGAFLLQGATSNLSLQNANASFSTESALLQRLLRHHPFSPTFDEVFLSTP